MVDAFSENFPISWRFACRDSLRMLLGATQEVIREAGQGKRIHERNKVISGAALAMRSWVCTVFVELHLGNRNDLGQECSL